MDPERWRRVREVVDAVLEAGAGTGGGESTSEVEALLARECGEDRELRSEVESLLAAHSAAGPLDRSPFALLDDPPADPAGMRIGAYRVVREIGRGGMGAVFLAERADREFDQRVAIKRVSAGAWRPDLVERFRAERRILARLDHPGIARLLDGGATEDGLPYVVMEHVEGRPIDRYADEERLDVEERIRLFLAVADAVDAAHRNLVVHRDLKPSNVLVTAAGEPKLLDFGIAKPFDPEAGGEPAATFTSLAMTPEYASPEQVRGEPATPASDVYSLGIVLYELLAGRRPYTLGRRSAAEVERVVTEGEIPPPSETVRRTARGGAGDTDAVAVAERRRTTPERLRRRLAGDLDTIVAEALRVDPERRYPAVRDLAADLRRHLASEPVLARPDGLGYRVGRFVRRHRVGVTAAALLVAALSTGLGATLYQGRVAELQRERAERRFAEVRELAGSFIFEVDEAVADLPGSTAARELIVRRARDYLERLSADDAADPALTRELAVAWRKVGDIQGNPRAPNLGDLDGAAASYRRARELLAPLLLEEPSPEDRRILGDLTRRTGEVLWWQGETEEAIDRFERAAELHAEVRAERPHDAENLRALAAAWTALGDIHSWNRANDRALGFYAEALPLRRELGEAAREGPEREAALRDLAGLETSIGDTLTWDGRPAEGVERLDGAVAMLGPLVDEGAPDASTVQALAVAHTKRGEGLLDLGRPGEALAAAEEALRLYERLARADPFDLGARRYAALGHAKRGDALLALERPGDAAVAFRRSLDLNREVVAADPANVSHQHDLANAHGRLGRALEAAGELDRAAAEYESALALRHEVLDADPEEDAALRALYLAQSDLGDVHLARARERPAGDDRREELERAAEWLRRARASLEGLAARGALPAVDAGEMDSVDRRLAEVAELAHR